MLEEVKPIVDLRWKHLPTVGQTLEKALAIDKVNQVYRQIVHRGDEKEFIQDALDILGVKYAFSESELKRIPKTGPAIVVANHPYGGIEGMILSFLLLSVRDDVKVMANYVLGKIREMQNLFILVDPFSTNEAARMNIRPLREAIRWVEEGKLLAIFPAGEVSHVHLKQRRVTDPPWRETVARIVRKTGAPVIPVHFQGANSVFFQIAGMVHPLLRTLLLPREMTNKANHKINIRIGRPIPAQRLDRFDDLSLTRYLRFRTYMLSVRSKTLHLEKKAAESRRKMWKNFKVIERPQGADLLAAEVEGLAADRKLLESTEAAVYFANANEIPSIVREIGRLREISFRREGEGCGKSLDLDPFDQHYVHLFVWNKKEREVVGAYRIGRTDDILKRIGLPGVYTSTLFRYSEELLRRMGPALELGRSFVRPKYQRSLSALPLLWKGICRYVSRHPQYKMLFGPVSISDSYSDFSKRLLVEYLNRHHRHEELAHLVKSRVPFRGNSLPEVNFNEISSSVESVEELSELIGEMETSFSGIPILLKHYLRVGGRILQFNVDPDFSNSLDGLILVDLTKSAPRVLSGYMGKEEGRRFLEFHGIATPDNISVSDAA